jgi:hypothetical protein
MREKLRRFVRRLSCWAWTDVIDAASAKGGVPRWNTLHDWWHWYAVEVGANGGHDVRGHAEPIVRKAWDAAREHMA